MPTCKADTCNEECIAHSEYCDEHTLQQQVADRPRRANTLRESIERAKKKNLLKPQPAYTS